MAANYCPDYDVLLAERAAVIAEYYAENKITLGNEGLLAHYNAVAQLAIKSFDKFPVLFDWDKHIAQGGDCWDIEIAKLADEAAIDQ
jgi:hypothetical protein